VVEAAAVEVEVEVEVEAAGAPEEAAEAQAVRVAEAGSATRVAEEASATPVAAWSQAAAAGSSVVRAASAMQVAAQVGEWAPVVETGWPAAQAASPRAAVSPVPQAQAPRTAWEQATGSRTEPDSARMDWRAVTAHVTGSDVAPAQAPARRIRAPSGAAS
jgi:hypothetical protein